MSKADFLHCQASETLKVVSSHFATSFQANAKYSSNSHGWGCAMLRRGPCLLPLKLRGNKVTQIDYGPSASPVAMQCKNVYIQLARKDLLVHMHKCEASIT